jgi:hypothetical protein
VSLKFLNLQQHLFQQCPNQYVNFMSRGMVPRNCVSHREKTATSLLSHFQLKVPPANVVYPDLLSPRPQKPRNAVIGRRVALMVKRRPAVYLYGLFLKLVKFLLKTMHRPIKSTVGYSVWHVQWDPKASLCTKPFLQLYLGIKVMVSAREVQMCVITLRLILGSTCLMWTLSWCWRGFAARFGGNLLCLDCNNHWITKSV